MTKEDYLLLDGLDLAGLATPSYVLDLGALRRNLELLADVKQRVGCQILLSQKSFAVFGVYPMLRWYLDGVSAGSVFEARLGHEEMGGEVQVMAPAYSEADILELQSYSTSVVFRAYAQWDRFRGRLAASAQPISPGLRLNPEYSEAEREIFTLGIYGARLGIRRREMDRLSLEGIEGFSFHKMGEQNAGMFERMLKSAEERFGEFFSRVQWLSFTGGHRLTAGDYDVDRFCRVFAAFRQAHPVRTVFLDPGEAVSLNAGVLVASVLEIVPADLPVVVLDVSAAAHMPDVLVLPYRPQVLGADLPRRKSWTCRLAGLSSFTGDVIGEYSFDAPLRIGDKLVFQDMANGTMVKNNWLNGLRLPTISTWDPVQKNLRVIRSFDYGDFKNRLS
jgi:carboxynorspermidine decarboxylase